MLSSGSINARGDSGVGNSDSDEVGLRNDRVAVGGLSKVPEANRSSVEESEARGIGSRIGDSKERRHDEQESKEGLHTSRKTKKDFGQRVHVHTVKNCII